MTSDASEHSPAHLPKVEVKGEPTDDELGAAMTVLAALTTQAGPRENDDRQVPSGWESYWRMVRQPFIPAHEGWRGSVR